MMKQLFLVFAFLSFCLTFSQNSSKDFLDKTLIELKKESKSDSKDLRIINLFESFYNEVLQSEKGELSEETIKQFQIYLGTDKISNNHLLVLLLMYQENVTQNDLKDEKTNSEFQLDCIELLEKECKDIYSKIPAIVYIYKVESLDANNKKDESYKTIIDGLKVYPNSVPLKVYSFLHTNDNVLKEDLIKNHKNHWLVKQFDIK